MSKLKPCPFCGEVPYLERVPMWSQHNGSTHGYYGCYEYIVECHNPECRCRVYLGKNDTIYHDDATAGASAVNAWNRRYKE